MTTGLEQVLKRITDDLDSLGRAFAVVGGLAVSARAEPRFTRDIDFAVSVSNDEAAVQLVRELRSRGYALLAVVEQESTGRLATVRLSPTWQAAAGVVIDLLFASSGIEVEVVGAAEKVDIFPDLCLPVAQLGHLLALKLLSRASERPQDDVDIAALLQAADPQDVAMARAALVTITARGYHRNRDLVGQADQLLLPGGTPRR